MTYSAENPQKPTCNHNHPRPFEGQRGPGKSPMGLVTMPAATAKKGKGVSMAEEPDPEVISPTLHNPMSSSGPVLTGPHTLDHSTIEGPSSNPAASSSVSQLPKAGKSVSNPPATPRSASNTRQGIQNKGTCKPLTTGVSKNAASVPEGPPRNKPALVDDLLNLQAAMQHSMAEGRTQPSVSSQTEEDKTETTPEDRGSMSKFNTIFWDIEPYRELPVWAEPIMHLSAHMFGVFDPAADEDVLVPLGAIDGVLPGHTKYKCDWLRSALEQGHRVLFIIKPVCFQ
ncbi:uncharacterized protein LACBIDRAFT_323266 [Laccaria bicolor S238N-H82]|uniref:Predicted protein n=1 Tax=Laccaria bicolor (strain S238N-H82 / ATCC MYA-4686) TaxID=486041 RepID=B0CZN6_LACBS|nr:uncharacterized protein LACBIDRAFT_323266 [Laccaria bicolor S238N-H82]EDR12181.1 predicted protein [Laccaria bicolor S238N-H82]|eukprot:XP_001876445.1 predicted protein [Laccaria bicolor S238N-H82]